MNSSTLSGYGDMVLGLAIQSSMFRFAGSFLISKHFRPVRSNRQWQSALIELAEWRNFDCLCQLLIAIVGAMRLTFAWFNILSFSNSECTFYDETPIGKSTVRCVLMQCTHSLTHSHTPNATCIFIFSTSIDWVSSLCFRVFIYSTLRSSLCSMLRSSIIHLVRMAQTISKAMAGQSRQMHFLKKQRTDNSVHTNAGIH